MPKQHLPNTVPSKKPAKEDNPKPSQPPKPQVRFAEPVHNEDPSITIDKLTDETMQHLIKIGDANLAKWGYPLMKIKVREYWAGIAKSADDIKREQLRKKRYFPQLTDQKQKDVVDETKRKQGRFIHIDGDALLEALAADGLLKKRPNLFFDMGKK